MLHNNKNNSTANLFLDLGLIGAPAASTNDDANIDAESGANNKEVNTTKPAQTKGYVDFVVTRNEDDTLTAEEAWDLINQNQLDGDKLGKCRIEMDGNKWDNSFMAIVVDDVELNNYGIK